MEPFYGYMENSRVMKLYQQPVPDHSRPCQKNYHGNDSTQLQCGDRWGENQSNWRDYDPLRYDYFHRCAVANPRRWVLGKGKHRYSLRDRLAVWMRKRTKKLAKKRGRGRKVKNGRRRNAGARNRVGRNGRRTTTRRSGDVRRNGVKKKKVGVIPRKKRASPDKTCRKISPKKACNARSRGRQLRRNRC